MRQFCLVFTAALGIAAPALAQVTVDLHALDALPGAKTAPKERTVHKPATRPSQRQAATKPHEPSPPPATEQQAALPAATAPPPGTTAPAPATPPPATLPTAPPPTAALAPVAAPPPAAEAAPPSPPPISESANSAATKTGAGLRVTFGAGQADLSPASAAAIKNVVQSGPAGDSSTFNVVAYAAGTPEDPSTARRLSLSRALAVRDALMANGVTSSRIYVRALGAPAGDETPDRVDLAVLGGNSPAAEASTKGQSP